ncbi:hypothetical protein ACK1X7_31040 [Streptomyces sp. CY1]|uniref:hypothetical protein n=1 Tax=Streptomyces sp. CY1 TaxID=3388313 RepID=UPI0039A0E951
MTHPVLSFSAAPDLLFFLAASVPAALVLVLTAWTIRRRGTRTQKRLGGPAIKVAALAALGCTAYSADTSWRFAADYLDMAGTAERVGMFAAAELALFATALMARQNLTAEGAPGLPGTLVWMITGVQVIPAYAESGPIGGTVRAFVGPVMAAMLWHIAMGIELRLRTPGAASHGLIAVLGRETRERLLSRLGIAAQDRDAAQITRDRATARAVALAARLAERTPEQQRSWRGRRLTRRLSKAVGRASVGTDAFQRTQLLDQLAARRHALALATVPLPSPWSPAHSTATAATIPMPSPVPVADPHGPNASDGGRGPSAPRGPVPEPVNSNASAGSGTEGNEVGTEGPEAGAAPGTDPASPEGAEENAAGTGTDRTSREAPAQGLDSHRGPTDTDTGTETTRDRGPTDTDTGTETTRDRGPTDTDTGTETTRDRGPTDTDTGTETTRDRGHKVPLRRKSTTKPRTKNKGKRGGPRTPQTQRPPREPEQSVDQLVQQVRPHVPALLERDGNESVTRVQLREILRREGLKGGRNDRLSLVLQELRSEDATTKARSTTR